MVGCNDDISVANTKSSVMFSASAGTNYWVQVGGKGTDAGTIHLNTDLIPSLAVGDTNRINIPQSSMGTKDAGEPNPCSITCTYTYWARLDIIANGTLSVDTTGSAFNTVLGLSVGTTNLNYATLSALGCNDDFGGTTRSKVTAIVTAGTTVWAQVGGKNGSRGSLKINYHLAP
jgi:hypothetical protein